MQTTRLATIPIEALWKYREFKRDEAPVPVIPVIQSYGIDEITEYVLHHGLEPLELSIVGDRALLTDGNHRIVAAKRLSMQKVPVNVIVFLSDGRERFYPHTLERFV